MTDPVITSTHNTLMIRFTDKLTWHIQGISPGGAVFPHDTVVNQPNDHTLYLKVPKQINLRTLDDSHVIELEYDQAIVGLHIRKIETLALV